MFKKVLLASCIAVSFVFSCNGAPPVLGPSSSLTVGNQVISPDGFRRDSVLVNGVFPAPVIKGNKGDRFRLNVVNTLKDVTMQRSTSIHWHGLFQHQSAWADGVVGVTQCPISPNNSFLYDFTVPDQAGTFWYHSHFSTQYCDGLRGPLIVYDPRDPHKGLYDIDDETTIITLSDWYHTPAPSIKGIASADTTLINGKGRYPGGPSNDLAVVNVVKGKRYRFRVISMSCNPNFMFSIDGHKLTIIEVDGENIHPHSVDKIQIFSAQRYSIILNANQPVDNYWIRSLPNSGYRNISYGFNGGINSAILRYKGAPSTDPTSSNATCIDLLNESDLHPLTNPAAPGHPWQGGADVNINLQLGFDAAAFRFSINNHSYNTPSVPVLLQILSGAQRAQDLLPEGSLYSLPRNKVVEITIPGGLIGGPHPFHLHGHSFSVVRSAGNDTKFNYLNPVRRDVVNVGDAGSNVVVRFTTDNAGPWFLHCHIDFHLEIGLAIVFAEDPQDAKQRDPVPNSWKQLCPIYDSLSPSQTSLRTVPSAS